MKILAGIYTVLVVKAVDKQELLSKCPVYFDNWDQSEY